MTSDQGQWPNLFIIGAPKCGTTSIAEWLAQHSDVHMSHPKEPGYFNDDYKDGHFRRRPKRFKKLFAEAGDKTWRCDGTVDYLASDVAVPNIVKVAPDAKFIVAVRNHADLVFSLHQEERVSGNELVSDFKTAFELSSERRAGRKIPITGPERRKIDYEKRVEMGAQLERALKHINRDQLLLIDFDMLKNDSSAVWTEICKFLGIEAEPVSLVSSNPRKSISSVPVTILRKYLRRIKRTIGATSDYGLSKPVRNMAVSVEQDRQVLADDLRKSITEKYSSDLALLRTVANSGNSILLRNGWLDHG